MPTAMIDDTVVYLANPEPTPQVRQFIGRTRELDLCSAAWGIDCKNGQFASTMFRLHFRLQGPPGVGKNEIVYELVRRMARKHDVPFYMIQGHEEMTPEDLALVLVPDPEASTQSNMPLVLRASPLATALYEGGFFFFDEINRVPERALTPLASVLDSRQYLYSALAGIHVRPKNDEARRRFRFCCALNPQVAEAGRGVLPDYIEQRTLPVINVDYPSFDDLYQIIKDNLDLDQGSPILAEFKEWHRKLVKKEVSVRQAISLIMFVMNSKGKFQDAEAAIFGQEPRASD